MKVPRLHGARWHIEWLCADMHIENSADMHIENSADTHIENSADMHNKNWKLR